MIHCQKLLSQYFLRRIYNFTDGRKGFIIYICSSTPPPLNPVMGKFRWRHATLHKLKCQGCVCYCINVCSYLLSHSLYLGLCVGVNINQTIVFHIKIIYIHKVKCSSPNIMLLGQKNIARSFQNHVLFYSNSDS